MISFLLIDDDQEYCNEFKRLFSTVFKIETLSDMNQAFESMDSETLNKYDVVVVDLYLGNADGVSLILKYREDFLLTPPFVLMTQKNDEKSRIFSYKNNISDFLDKSLSPEEIQVRIERVVKESHRTNPCYKGLKFDATQLAFTLDELQLDLTKQEMKILFAILSSHGQAIEKDALNNRVWPRRGISSQTLNSHIFNINRKLEKWTHKVGIDAGGQIRVV